MSKRKRLKQPAPIAQPVAPVSPSRYRWAAVAVILLAGFLSYSNVFSNSFLYDDEHYVVRNPYIRDFTHLKEIFTSNVGAGVHRPDNFYRPMQIFLYTVAFQIKGLSVGVYHAVNLVIHCSNALLIFALALTLGAPFVAAFGMGLLFVVHPVHTEAVTYMNGTADPLAVFWILLGLLAHCRIQLRAVRIPTVSLLGILALLSKETAMAFPLLVMLVDIYRRQTNRDRMLEWAVPWIWAATYMGLRMTVFNFTKSLNLFATSNIYTEHLYVRFFTFLAGLKEYAIVLFWPADLRYDRAMSVYTSLFLGPVLWGAAIVSLAVVQSWRSWRKDRHSLLGWAWFFIGLGPVCGLIPINGFAMEHWLYLPIIGILWMVVPLLIRSTGTPAIAVGALLFIAVPLGARTYQRNRDWKDPITFYSDILRHNPHVARVHNNLAMTYADQGRLDESIAHYQAAIALEDVYPETHHNLAQVYITQGRVPEAIAEFERAIALQPRFVYAHLRLAEIFRAQKDDARARRHAEIAREILSSKN